ncbi:MAG: DUF4847 family protein [Bacteroides sp.]|nr:DUF4847 family protein [Bacteroides sp.]
MKLKSILYILSMLMILPFLWSCNNEDDVEEIFASGTWYVVDYFTKANWDKRNGTPKYNAMANNSDKTVAAEGRRALQTIHNFSLTFKADGNFTGDMQGGSFEGTWQADGKDRTAHFTIKGNPNTSNSYSKEFIETLNNVVFYQGDNNVLMLGPEDKRSYIQFAHKKQE